MSNDVGSAAHSDDAERIVLGALMIQPQLVDEVSDIIASADFYRPTHASVYAAITANAALGEPTDPVAIAITLEKFGELARVGGAAYLHTLMASVPTSTDRPTPPSTQRSPRTRRWANPPTR